jgi:hypothetical protein
MLRPVVGISDSRASLDRPYAYASALRNDGQPRTAIDYRFAPDGLVGRVGYLRVIDGHSLDSHEAGLAASPRFGRQGSLVGAALSYAFK